MLSDDSMCRVSVGIYTGSMICGFLAATVKFKHINMTSIIADEIHLNIDFEIFGRLPSLATTYVKKEDLA